MQNRIRTKPELAKFPCSDCFLFLTSSYFFFMHAKQIVGRNDNTQIIIIYDLKQERSPLGRPATTTALAKLAIMFLMASEHPCRGGKEERTFPQTSFMANTTPMLSLRPLFAIMESKQPSKLTAFTWYLSHSFSVFAKVAPKGTLLNFWELAAVE